MPMGGLEVIIILVIILLFFGAKRIPQLARSLGTGARELKKAASEDADEGETKATSGGGPSDQDRDRVYREPRAE